MDERNGLIYGANGVAITLVVDRPNAQNIIKAVAVEDGNVVRDGI